jgi:hypothetical protein
MAKMGSHHGAINAAHLEYYLDEFTFRFNRRRTKGSRPTFLPPAPASGAARAGPYKHLVGRRR